ncbi:MAG: DinB superfamily protein [Acidobacteria bacterium OLB17]|nr:MAG: DinB superfamily protein [Acidobacteria bacterium OLB17]MCZ2390492.1 DinB family protein [Acidobacteriota bacterium]
MEYNSLGDIYAAADSIREKTREFADSISAEESAVLAAGETWTLRAVFEHVSLVDDQILWVVNKLVSRAERASSGGIERPPLAITGTFAETLNEFASAKLTAPERVQPTGDIPIPDSILRLDDALNGFAGLRERLEAADLLGHKIPHPYLGELTAPEWMVLRNGHEVRHVSQAKAILEKIRQK